VAAGVRDLPQNFALRAILRREYAPFTRPPAPPPPRLADTDPAIARETIARAEREPRATGPRATGAYISINDDLVRIGTVTQQSWGPIARPYIIRHVAFTLFNNTVATDAAQLRASLHLTGEDRAGDTGVPSEARIWPNFGEETNPVAVLRAGGLGENSIIYPAGILVLTTNQFLTVAFETIPGANARATIGLNLEEVDPSGSPIGGETLSVPDTAARYIGDPRPPQPRTPARRLPIAFTFQVRQAGSILFARTIPYSSAAAFQALYDPGTGAADPNVIVHYDQGSALTALNTERQAGTR